MVAQPGAPGLSTRCPCAPSPSPGRAPLGSGQRHAQAVHFDCEDPVARPVVRRVAPQELELDRVTASELVSVAMQLEGDRAELAFVQPVDAAADEPLFA